MLQPGTIILSGKYRIEGPIGKGAFAQVYRATHLELNIARAIKVLPVDTPGMGSTTFSDYHERYRQEFQIAARLDHPNVIKVHDLVEEQGALYAVLEYAAGGSVKDLLANAERGALPIERAIQILLDCAAGLDALHEKLGVIHRDIKPANILLDADGRAQIADLGLAQVGGGSSSMRSVLGSAAGIHPGTPNYRSPEHNTWEPLTPTSDVYSLGCVAFEMLTGQIWKQVMYKVTRVRDLRPDVPEWLDALVIRMLCKTPGLVVEDATDPQKRYVSVDAIVANLSRQTPLLPTTDDRRPASTEDVLSGDAKPGQSTSLPLSYKTFSFDDLKNNAHPETWTIISASSIRRIAQLGFWQANCALSQVTLSENGRLLVIATSQRIVALDPTAWKTILSIPSKVPIRSVALSDDTFRIFSGDDLGNVYTNWNSDENLYDIWEKKSTTVQYWISEQLRATFGTYIGATFKFLQTKPLVSRGHLINSAPVCTVPIQRLLFSGNPYQHVVSATAQGIHGWSYHKGDHIQGIVRCMAIWNGYLICGGSGGQISITDFGGESKVLTERHNGIVTSLAISRDRLLMTTGSSDGRIKLWDLQGFDTYPHAPHLDKRKLAGTNLGSSVTSLGFSRDGGIFASGGADGVLRFWNTANGEPLKSVPAHTKPITDLFFTPDGHLVITASEDNIVRFWHVPS